MTPTYGQGHRPPLASTDAPKSPAPTATPTDDQAPRVPRIPTHGQIRRPLADLPEDDDEA